jgi:hypothetical protein
MMSDKPVTPSRELMVEFERRADAAYAAMYDAPSHNEKDFKDDALFYLARAIEIARAIGLSEEVERLQKRSDGIMGVYSNQFRCR